MAYRDPPRLPVKDEATQQAVDELRRAMMELARQLVYRDVTVTLPDATNVVVRHGLGRPFLHYTFTAPVGASTTGRIDEIARTADSITLNATGFGGTISVGMRFW